MTDAEKELAVTISRVWGYTSRVHHDARDLAKTLILKGYRRTPALLNSETGDKP